jgi:hypothetical protein
MAVETNSVSRARRLGLLALLAASTAGLLAAGGASAGWRAAAIAAGGGARVRITSKPLLGLYPGARRGLTLIVHNRDRHRRVIVRRLRVRNTRTSRRGCAPSRRNLVIRQYAGRPFAIAPRGTRRVVVQLRMPNTVANSCQRAVFGLQYSAVVATRDRTR